MAVSFQFKSNASNVNAKMSNMVARQLPFAISKAMNATADTLVRKNRQDMSLIFDNTVPWTLNAFTRSKHRAGPTRILTANDVRAGNTSMYVRRKSNRKRHYLEVQETGGTRPKTGLENLVSRNLPTARIVGTVTPTRHFPRKANGGLSGGELNRIMSAMHLTQDKAQRSAVYGQAGKTKRSRQYFVPAPSHPLGQGKRFGIYYRNPVGNVKKMLNISERRPRYKAKFRFEERMHRYSRGLYPKKLQASLKMAMATARLK